MKTYMVMVDVTMSKNVYVNAKSEQDAKEKVDKLFKEEPYSYANNFNAYLGHEIIDCVLDENNGEE